jgi:hypothetical protein
VVALSKKWILITSIDDYSRLLLYVEFVLEENAWVRIRAAQAVLHEEVYRYNYKQGNSTTGEVPVISPHPIWRWVQGDLIKPKLNFRYVQYFESLA